ncbi:hypothetical protein Tco_0036587, partial [Tanacetum coccineum]
CDSVLYEDFSEVDALPSTNNEDKVFNSGILIHENLFKVTIRVISNKNEKKISITNASLILDDFNPPLYELPFHKEVPGFETLLSFSSENEEKVFNPGILTSKGVHTSLLLELSHWDSKAFKVINIFASPMEIFPCSYEEDIRVFLPSPECDSVLYEDFPRLMLCLQPITRTKYLIRDFNPPLYELPFHKKVLGFETLLSFSSENEEKVFNLGILTSKGVHTSLLLELSHRDSKAFKVINIFASPMEIFPCSYGEDIRVLDVSCLHFYPS